MVKFPLYYRGELKFTERSVIMFLNGFHLQVNFLELNLVCIRVYVKDHLMTAVQKEIEVHKITIMKCKYNMLFGIL